MHIKSIHENIKDNRCTKCDYKTTQKERLKMHIKSIHENIKDNRCTKCDYKTTQKQRLKMHIKYIHGNKMRQKQVPKQHQRSKTSIPTMKIATLNTRTLNDSHLDHFLAELEHVKWQIVGLCETKLHETRNTIEENGHSLFNSGNNRKKKEM